MIGGNAPVESLSFDVQGLVEQVLALQPQAAVLVFDAELRIVVAAGPGLARHGWAEEALVGTLVAELVPPATFAELEPHYRRALAGDAHGGEFDSLTTGCTYLQHFSGLRDAAGAVAFGLTAWQELTEVRRAERELAASEERYRLLAERSTDVIITFDRELRFRFVSPAMERVTGWKPAELLDRPIPEFIHPDDLPAIAERVMRLFGGDELSPSEFRLRRADGGWTWIEGIETPITDDAGTIVALQATGRDISARKHAESLFRAVAEVAPVGIFCARPDGTVTYINDRWTEITGLPKEESIGDGWAALLHPDDRDLATASWRKVVESGVETVVNHRIVRPAGDVRHVVAATVPLRDENDGVVAFVGSVTDVTELKRAEAEQLALESRLQQAQKLESLAVLAGGIAHDFNNLLVGILGNASLALGELAGDAPVRESLEQVEAAAQRAGELTRQMLAYAGGGRSAIGRIDLAALVRELTSLLAVAVGPGITIRLDLPRGLPAFEGDTTQIRQVVMSVIVNAADAIAGGTGVISVGLAVTDVGEAERALLVPGTDVPPGRYLALRVADTGIGMDQATRSRMFEPFFTTKLTGRGLGLAATLGIVRGHGGAVVVESVPGRGTVLTLYLPFVDDAAAPAGVAAGGPAGAASPPSTAATFAGTVLLVDDDPLVRDVTRRMLEAAGATVRVVANGAAAIEAARSDPTGPSVLLLDLSMPGVTGVDLVAALRETGLACPIVVTSGHSSDAALARLAEVGVGGFLPKPFTSRELVAALTGVVGT